MLFRRDRRDARYRHTWQRYHAGITRRPLDCGRKAGLDKVFQRARASLTRRAVALTDAKTNSNYLILMDI